MELPPEPRRRRLRRAARAVPGRQGTPRLPEDPTFPEDEFKRELIPFDHLDPIWGFNASELIHFSDVRAMHGVYGEPFNTPDGIIEWRYPDEGAQG